MRRRSVSVKSSTVRSSNESSSEARADSLMPTSLLSRPEVKQSPAPVTTMVRTA